MTSILNVLSESKMFSPKDGESVALSMYTICALQDFLSFSDSCFTGFLSSVKEKKKSLPVLGVGENSGIIGISGPQVPRASSN